MTEGLSSSYTQLKRVPIRERAFTIGDLTCINGYHANRMLLKRRFIDGGYLLQETPHFMLCTRTTAPSTILVHWFPPEEIDADIGNRFMQELKPPGLLSDAQQFGQVFAVVGIDIETESFPIMRAIAEQQQLKHVRFIQAALLAGDLPRLGSSIQSLHYISWSISTSPTCAGCLPTCSRSHRNGLFSPCPMNQTSRRSPMATNSFFLATN